MRLLFCLLFLYCVSLAGPRVEGQVIKVVDGDTFHMLVKGTRFKVRLQGVDSPEKNQPFGLEATRVADSLLSGKFIRVDIQDTDRYGRLVGVVWLGKIQISLWLVAHGYAWWYQRYAPKDRALALAEQQARQKHIGLWNDPNAIAPWDWRKKGKSENHRIRWTPNRRVPCLLLCDLRHFGKSSPELAFFEAFSLYFGHSFTLYGGLVPYGNKKNIRQSQNRPRNEFLG
ncbi:MAG TPA: thermonuclease family protein [Fibrobacteraceae bacterium]|nr:thermonuclease family protein [Fibrobacteraceae bacterium]